MYVYILFPFRSQFFFIIKNFVFLKLTFWGYGRFFMWLNFPVSLFEALNLVELFQVNLAFFVQIQLAFLRFPPFQLMLKNSYFWKLHTLYGGCKASYIAYSCQDKNLHYFSCYRWNLKSGHIEVESESGVDE